jgi:hypothetical protein
MYQGIRNRGKLDTTVPNQNFHEKKEYRVTVELFDDIGGKPYRR